MPFTRCAHYDDDGNPVGGGCPRGSNCDFVHPSHQSDWARAPTSFRAMRKKQSESSFRPPPLTVKSRWLGMKAPKASSSKPGTSSAEGSQPATPDPDAEMSNAFDSFGSSFIGASDNGWGTKAPAKPKPVTLESAFEDYKGKPTVSSVTSPPQIEPVIPVEPAVAPPPPPVYDPDSATITSPVRSRTPIKSNKFSNAGFIDRSNVEDREPGEVLSSPLSATFADRAPLGTPKPVSFLEMHTDSERFLRQLLDATFKTDELKEAEEELARKRRMMYSAYYERASHATRKKFEKERQSAEEDRFVKDERLHSRLARLAELPNIDTHLAEIAPALNQSDTLFANYLQSIDGWRGVLAPYMKGLWEEHKARVRKEEELARDKRPDWLKNAPQLKGQYDKLIQLEQSLNDFVLEREDREMQDDQTIMSELARLAEEGDQQLQEAVERGKQEKVDSHVKQIVAELKVRGAALRRQVDALRESIGVELDQEVEREPRANLQEYMASIRERVRQHHVQHVERIQALKTQHTAVDGLLKQTEPVPAYDFSKLVSEAETIVQRQVDERVEHAVGQLRITSENVLAKYETQQVRFLWESSEPIRLVEKYVDSDEVRRSQARTLQEEHTRTHDPKAEITGT